MNSLTSNPTAAEMVARRMIQDRVEDASRRTRVRSARAARASRRSEQHPARAAVSPAGHELPWWAFRYLFPVR